MTLADVTSVGVRRHWGRSSGTSWDVGLERRRGRFVLAAGEGRDGADALASVVRNYVGPSRR
jgi:hypothetical protein